MRKKVSTGIICAGVILFLIGLFTKVPNKELTTYTSLKDEYSVIEEYVGGDAYNYIIGASLVGGEIAGAKAQKAIFISFGVLIACGGLLVYPYDDKSTETVSEENTEGDVTENE